MDGPDHDRAEEIALFRFAVIAEVVNPRLSAAQRGLAVRALAERTWECPDGTTRTFSRTTLDRWVAAYRARGLGGLHPQPRADAI